MRRKQRSRFRGAAPVSPRKVRFSADRETPHPRAPRSPAQGSDHGLPGWPRRAGSPAPRTPRSGATELIVPRHRRVRRPQLPRRRLPMGPGSTASTRRAPAKEPTAEGRLSAGSHDLSRRTRPGGRGPSPHGLTGFLAGRSLRHATNGSGRRPLRGPADIVTVLETKQNLSSNVNVDVYVGRALDRSVKYGMRCSAISLSDRNPGDVSLFVYDNDTFIVESFLPETVDAKISLDPRFGRIRELTTGEELAGQSGGAAGGFGGFGASGRKRTVVPVKIKPHSYLVFSARP